MKTLLPVIQNSIPAASAERGPAQTEHMRPDPERTAALRPSIVAALTKVFDPEIPVNVYDLGLVYDIVVDRAGVP